MKNRNEKKDYTRHMGRRAAAYLRASESELHDRVDVARSILDQDEKIRAFCKQKGYVPSCDHFEADRTPGTFTPEERPGMGKLLEAARRREFDFLVVTRLDRLARNTKILLRILHEFEMCGVAVKSATESLEFDKPSGRLLMSVLTQVSEVEREYSSRGSFADTCRSCQSWEEASDIDECHSSD